MKYIPILLLLFAALLAVTAHAAEDNRRVLALYDKSMDWASEPFQTDIHEMLEMPLNRLGMIVDYHEISNRPLPDPAPYRAIIIWSYNNRMVQPREFLHWVRGAISNGVRLVVIEGFGAEEDLNGVSVPESELAAAYAAFGLRAGDTIEETLNPFIIERTDFRPEHFNIETELPPEKSHYTHWIPIPTNAQVWRALSRRDVPDSQAAAVVILPNGGFISDAEEMFRRVTAPFPQRLWDLDATAFLQAALDCAGMLRPDVTTVNGCRAAYSHVDGDGIINGTIDLPQQALASEVLYNEVLSQVPLPITVGTIVGRVDTNAAGTQPAIDIARRIHALPNIEGAIHGWAHMFDWYDLIPGLIWTGYTFTPEAETIEANNYLNEHIMPPGKTSRIMQWTGDCVPQEEVIAVCEANNLLNINGGDSRYDALFRSLSNITPLSRVIGAQRQIYASAQNENLYTELWTTNFGGYSQVIDTFRNSESPQRLLPVNIYYHIYIAERAASLASLKEVYDWALKQPLCWITTSEYIESVLGFFRAKLGHDTNGLYWAENYAPCNTMRLDNCPRNVDMTTARNVTGFTHTNGSLYVSLADAPRAEFSLTDAAPTRLCLNESTALLREITSDAQHWQASARLFAPGFIRLQGARPQIAYQVNDKTLKADPQGILHILLPAGVGQWTNVNIQLEGGAPTTPQLEGRVPTRPQPVHPALRAGCTKTCRLIAAAILRERRREPQSQAKPNNGANTRSRRSSTLQNQIAANLNTASGGRSSATPQNQRNLGNVAWD
jgi:hypothetical protein